MSEILPIGTVIKIKEYLLMIVGYKSIKGENAILHYYGVVPYPLGFLDDDSFNFILMDSSFDIVYRGYSSNESDKYIQNKSHLKETTNEVSLEMWNSIERRFIEMLEGGDINV